MTYYIKATLTQPSGTLVGKVGQFEFVQPALILRDSEQLAHQEVSYDVVEVPFDSNCDYDWLLTQVHKAEPPA